MTIKDKQGRHWNVHGIADLVRGAGKLGTGSYVNSAGLQDVVGVIADIRHGIASGRRFEVYDVTDWFHNNYGLNLIKVNDRLKKFSPEERAALMSARIDNLEREGVK